MSPQVVIRLKGEDRVAAITDFWNSPKNNLRHMVLKLVPTSSGIRPLLVVKPETTGIG